MMNFVLQTPSLKHLAAVKVVSHLWSQRDFFAQIPHSIIPTPVLTFEQAPEWKLIKDIIKSKVASLPLPEGTKKQLVHLIEPLGTEILRWCKYYNEDNNTVQLLDILLPPQLCWTMHGCIDYAKTAESMVKNERVDLQKRFEIACINCLEDEARQLFQRVSEERGQKYAIPILRYLRRKSVSISRYARRVDLSQLMLLFTQSSQLDVLGESLNFGNDYLFRWALRSDNRAMCEYLFQTFTSAERNQVLEDGRALLDHCVRIKSPSSNLLYYLSLMNEQQQRRMYRQCTHYLLICLLQWPMQALFMEVAKRGWQLMDNLHCIVVLSTIILKIGEGSNDYDYEQLFWECWALHFADFRDFYLNDFGVLERLLWSTREKFIKLVLNEATIGQLERAVSRIRHAFMDESVLSDAWLMECKQTAILNSSNDKGNVEKRLKSEYVSQLVDNELENRMKSREIV